MNKNINYNKLFGVEDSYQVPEKIMKTLYNKEEREKLFMELLDAHDYNVDFDWFHEYFEDEHADRKNKKQDFTPECVADLLSKLVMSSNNDESNGNYYEVAAGTGGIMIKHWDNFRKTFMPWDYKPQYHFAFVEELSDRAIPFLLMNMMLRGLNGVVLHVNSLTRECKNAYFICNTYNDHLKFSNISNIPPTKEFENELCVKFCSCKYVEHKELMDLDILENIIRR